jgi:hypothetical protein
VLWLLWLHVPCGSAAGWLCCCPGQLQSPQPRRLRGAHQRLAAQRGRGQEQHLLLLPPPLLQMCCLVGLRLLQQLQQHVRLQTQTGHRSAGLVHTGELQPALLSV